MILHVACLPFPSHQGTQAAIDAMLRASASAGESPHLLTYTHGAYALDAPYEVHRIPDFPKVRSLRSGPSLGKLALDIRCAVAVRKLARALRPSAIIAHHIEAALACLGAGVGPVRYFAHTSLEHELPFYFPGLPPRALSAIGAGAERWICSRAAGVAAVAPSLAVRLGEPARYVPVPWSANPTAPPLKREARAALGLPLDAQICLYAGNLDHYQGWEHLLEATVRLRQADSTARLLIASESARAPAARLAKSLDIEGALDFRSLDSEQARALAHAAADVAWVPRRSEGGLPIKMLDAFARGLPVVAMESATAGLPVRNACVAVPNDSPEAFAYATGELSRAKSASLSEQAFRYLTTHHSSDAYVAAMRSWLGDRNATQPKATPRAPRPQAAPARRAP